MFAMRVVSSSFCENSVHTVESIVGDFVGALMQAVSIVLRKRETGENAKLAKMRAELS